MYKNKFLKLTYVFVILFINLEIISINSFSNPLPGPSNYELGGILYENNNSLYLLEANVKFDIDCTDFLNNISLSFDGNYTIFNPTNNTINTTIYAPFNYNFPTDKSDWHIDVNDTAKEFSLVSPFSLDSMIRDYLLNYSGYVEYYIAINSSILAKNKQIIRYGLDISFKNPLYWTDYNFIRYILSSSKAWKNNISENVKFVVVGKLPNYYTEDTNKECILEDFPNGKSYSWNWHNETIEDDYVGITYRGRLLRPEEILFYTIFIIIGIGIITFLTIFFISRRRRKRKKS